MTIVRVEGWGQPVTLVAFYRKDILDAGVEAEWAQQMQTCSGSPWVAGGDWNQPVQEEETVRIWATIG